MSFKENLQYLRGSRNMTQEQLAMLLGVSRQAISKWESEKACPEMDKLLMLCDMFGVTLDDLVMGDVRASAGCGGAGRVDLAADTDGVAASVGVADAAGTDDRRRVAQTRLGLRSAAGCNRSHRRRGNGGRR